MSNNFITKISPSVRIAVLILLILSLLLANSIYLILFITTLTLILLIITNKKVNLYVKTLKKSSLLLLIFLVIYIIMFRQYNIVSIVVFSYKLILISILIKIFILNMDFSSIHEGLYGIFCLFKALKIDVEKVSLDVTLSFYFLKFLISSKENIKNRQLIMGRKILNVKNLILPSIVYSINQLEILQNNLKIKFYKINYKKITLTSKIMLVLFLTLFIICVLKEVVL